MFVWHIGLRSGFGTAWFLEGRVLLMHAVFRPRGAPLNAGPSNYDTVLLKEYVLENTTFQDYVFHFVLSPPAQACVSGFADFVRVKGHMSAELVCYSERRLSPPHMAGRQGPRTVTTVGVIGGAAPNVRDAHDGSRAADFQAPMPPQENSAIQAWGFVSGGEEGVDVLPRARSTALQVRKSCGETRGKVFFRSVAPERHSSRLSLSPHCSGIHSFQRPDETAMDGEWSTKPKRKS